MKKIIIIVVSIILAIALIIGGVIFWLTRPKEVITAQKFEEIATEKGYIVSNVKSQFSQYNYIQSAQVASSNDYSYQIEFYELIDENYAKNFYQNNKLSIESAKIGNYIENDVNISNYSIYNITTNEKYMYIARVDNTVLYISANRNVEETIKEFVKELKY